MDSLRGQIAGLTPAQRALLEQRLRSKGAQGSLLKGISRVADHSSAPLSLAQERLWFLGQLEPDNPFYNTLKAWRISGHLRVEALRRALDAIVERHEALRTVFVAVDGSPVQRIAPAGTGTLSVLELGGIPREEREAEARRLAAEEARRPFDLARGPLLRATLLRLGEWEHVLLIAVHHIVFDGWSRNILNSELAALYEAFCAGRPSPLSPLRIQYADFAVWQREWLRGELLESRLSYWKQRLSGAPSVPKLPTDRPRPAVQSYRGDEESLLLTRDLTEELHDLSRREGVTLFMTLLAAFQALLLRYTGREDIVVGSPMAGRNRAEIEGLIGFFVNTLVLRTDLSGDPSFRELLERVRETALGAYAHQDLPFEKLVEELQPERDLGQNPLFQVSFVLQNTSAASLELAGLELTSLPVESRTTHFDLEVFIGEEPSGLTCTFVYSTDLFDAGTIVRMMEHYQALLEGIVTDANRRVSELVILTQAERPVPSAMVTVGTLALTPNGKVSQRALPVPDQTRPELEDAFVTPGTPVEQVLAGIWREVLDLKEVSINDNFFKLGGHSLLATRVISRLREALPVELPLRALFEAPTVAGLAERLCGAGERVKVERAARLLLSLDRLSEDEVETMLEEKASSQKNGAAN